MEVVDDLQPGFLDTLPRVEELVVESSNQLQPAAFEHVGAAKLHLIVDEIEPWMLGVADAISTKGDGAKLFCRGRYAAKIRDDFPAGDTVTVACGDLVSWTKEGSITEGDKVTFSGVNYAEFSEDDKVV